MNFDRVAEHIKAHEGLSLTPYKCPAGKWTIGYGHNIEDNGIPVQIAEALLKSDIAGALKDLERIDTYCELDTERQMILVDMCFNLGISSLRRFRRMWAALADGDYVLAATEMADSQWYHQVGNRAKKLVDGMVRGEFPGAV